MIFDDESQLAWLMTPVMADEAAAQATRTGRNRRRRRRQFARWLALSKRAKAILPAEEYAAIGAEARARLPEDLRDAPELPEHGTRFLRERFKLLRERLVARRAA
jgi:hypothetical protein